MASAVRLSVQSRPATAEEKSKERGNFVKSIAQKKYPVLTTSRGDSMRDIYIRIYIGRTGASWRNRSTEPGVTRRHGLIPVESFADDSSDAALGGYDFIVSDGAIRSYPTGEWWRIAYSVSTGKI